MEVLFIAKVDKGIKIFPHMTRSAKKRICELREEIQTEDVLSKIESLEELVSDYENGILPAVGFKKVYLWGQTIVTIRSGDGEVGLKCYETEMYSRKKEEKNSMYKWAEKLRNNRVERRRVNG